MSIIDLTKDATLREAFRDTEGFSILGQEMFLPLKDLVNVRLAKLTEPGKGTAHFAVKVYAFIENTDKVDAEFCSALQQQAIGALTAACEEVKAHRIDMLQVQPFNQFTKLAFIKGWVLSGGVARRARFNFIVDGESP